VRSTKAELIELRSQVRDLNIALRTSNEHGDILQEHLYRLSASLTVEVRERQATDLKLRQLLSAVTQEKADLEILVQILVDQGDDWAEEGGKARIDGLTQIANRRGFDECLAQEWAAHVQLQQPLSLLVCDVDFFKHYNDHYGHQAGDECLKAVALAMGSCLRAQELVARYGGEEFAIILPRTDREAATKVAERVRSAVFAAHRPHANSSVCDRVTVSIGVACQIPPIPAGLDVRPLIEEADRFLYLAKRRGRNRVAHCEENSIND
jgi:diguanylate cyclase (GGDEF)-like protein